MKSKSYQKYIPGYHQIELIKDVTFDEDTSFRKSKKDKEDEEDHENTRAGEGLKPIRNK